jgi:hypothetical protein
MVTISWTGYYPNGGGKILKNLTEFLAKVIEYQQSAFRLAPEVDDRKAVMAESNKEFQRFRGGDLI